MPDFPAADPIPLPAPVWLLFRFHYTAALNRYGADAQAPGVARHLRYLGDRPLFAVCTHIGCAVQYEPRVDRIHCACHGGVYNPYTGANVSGPPPKPLKLFKAAINDMGVEISRA